MWHFLPGPQLSGPDRDKLVPVGSCHPEMTGSVSVASHTAPLCGSDCELDECSKLICRPVSHQGSAKCTAFLWPSLLSQALRTVCRVRWGLREAAEWREAEQDRSLVLCLLQPRPAGRLKGGAEDGALTAVCGVRRLRWLSAISLARLFE